MKVSRADVLQCELAVYTTWPLLALLLAPMLAVLLLAMLLAWPRLLPCLPRQLQLGLPTAAAFHYFASSCTRITAA